MTEKPSPRAEPGRARILPLVLFLAAAIMVAAGINLGEAEAVFEKAVIVCLSCIGIG